MANFSNTPRPAYVYDTATNEWVPVGVGAHSHNEIPKTVVDAKGDLIVGTAADTVARQAVGADGSYLVADSTQTTGVNWAGPSTTAGKNGVINGAFDIWQRGTSFTTANYTADRWFSQTSAGTTTFARESTVVPAGAQYSMKWTQATSAAYVNILQAIETANALPFVGKYVTLSAQVAASASQGVTLELYYATTVDKTIAGAGWTQITASSNANFTPSSTSFISASTLFLVPSTAKSLMVAITTSSIAAGNTFYVSNVQLELGSVATPFSRNAGTIQGELAACQRYYWRGTGDAYGTYGNGIGVSSTQINFTIPFVTTMRVAPTSVDYSTLRFNDTATANSISSITISTDTSNKMGFINATTTGAAQYRPYFIQNNNNAAGYLGFSAEL